MLPSGHGIGLVWEVPRLGITHGFPAEVMKPDDYRMLNGMLLQSGVCLHVSGHGDILPSSIDAINTLRPRQKGCHFPDDIFKWILLNENVRISIKISQKFVPKCPINNITALVQIMAWRRRGDKPLSEPVMVILLTHICVTRPQGVKLM